MCVCPLWQALSLWVIFSVHVVSEEGDYKSLQNFSQQCSNGQLDKGISLFLTNDSGVMEHKNSTYIVDYSIDEDIPALLDVFSGRLPPLNISCIVDMQNHLNFSWDTSGVPEHAQYSVSYLLCRDGEKVLESPKERLPSPVFSTVLGNQTHQDHIILQLNVSYPGVWYIQTQKWEILTVEKLDPPQFINTTIQSDQLYLKWDLPKSKHTKNPSCFRYELRINDEVRYLSKKLSHSEPNIDQTRTYKIQMRVKMLSFPCRGSIYWSDWTSVLNLGPLILQPDFHIGVMVTIALGLPMSLLAILLLCKFRIFYKLFPPIPGPSIKIKGLLEKDITSHNYQIISHKCVEEVTEVEVKEDEEEEEDEDEYENEEERL
ncbi:uncharacterized protein LOC116218220 isoform X2 [Clupea harengus]|uniref:Uncharacterized protein LOC116218220 isoform X2 n=1 Tax=Clupea harengus TaxID=7950 RepID=A0A6P8EQY1_CLUHA|nr:uncharacterized protein LOC116218220 isoform X2 [Clupea harengus]